MLRSFKNINKIDVGGHYAYKSKANKNWLSYNCLIALKNPNLITSIELNRILKKHKNLYLNKKTYKLHNKKATNKLFIKIQFTEWHHIYIKNYIHKHCKREEPPIIYFYNKHFIYNIINKLNNTCIK